MIMNDKQTLIEHDGKPFIGFVVDDPLIAYDFCRQNDDRPEKLLEPVIAENHATAYLYAIRMLNDKFELGEDAISEVDSYKDAYNNFIETLGYDPI